MTILYMNEPGRVPMSFIDGLRSLGVRLHDCGSAFGAMDNIRSDSPEYRDFLEMLSRLGDIKVEVCLGLKSQDPLYDPPGGPRPTIFTTELREQLRLLIPAVPDSWRGDACDKPRWLVESAVQMVEDPPERCTDARNIPEGHYVMSVEIYFANLICYVSVFRRSNLSPTVTESLGA